MKQGRANQGSASGAGRLMSPAPVAWGHDTDELISALLESMPDPVIGCDALGHVVYWSRAAREKYGYTPAEASGRSVLSLLQTRLALPLLEIIEEVTDLGHWRGRLVHRDKLGRDHTVESRWVARYDEAGRLLGGFAIERAVGGLDDFEQRVQAQPDPRPPARDREVDDLRRSERLESLSQLAAGLAHDFNNALAVIINYAAFVSSELDEVHRTTGDARWASMRGDLREVQTAAERAAELTHQLLSFSRQQVAPRALDLSALIGGQVGLLQRMLGEHIVLATDLVPGLPHVYADPGEIEEVLVNLAANARDAMPDGGTLAIDTAAVELDDASVAAYPELLPGVHVRLRLSDSGSGMTPQVRQRVFDPFFTTKPIGHGTGLGLSSVYGIITQMAGYARFYSEPDVGTTFLALLPAAEDAPGLAAPSHSLAAGAGGRGGETILVVEDDRALREVARRILVAAGYAVITAADGPAALEAVAGREPGVDLLLTDVVMAGMLGTALAERLRATHPGIRILYMSGFTKSVLGRATSIAARPLLEKPFAADALLAQIGLALVAS